MIDSKEKQTDPLRFPLKHERFPFPDIYIGGKPTFVLPKGSKRDNAKKTVVENIDRVNRVAALVASGLGPNCGYKVITVDEVSYLTSDTFTIFSKLLFKHPLEQVTAGAGIAASKVSGGGSTTTVILVAEILNELLPLIKDGMKQATAVAGCIMAYKRTMGYLDSLAFDPVEPVERIEDIISTALSGTVLHDHRPLFGRLLKEAVELNGASKPSSNTIDDVYIRTLAGGTISESRIVNGLALMREPMHMSMPKSVRDGRLLLVQGEFTIPLKGNTMFYEHKFAVDTPEGYRKLLTSKPEVLRGFVDRVLQTGANVVLLERGVEDYLIELFARKGIVLLRRFSPQEWQHVIEATGALPVTTRTATASDVVSVERVEYKQFGDTTWWFLEGFENPRSCEIFLRGPDNLFLQEADRILKGCLKSLRLFLQDPRLVYGGGSFEFALGEKLKQGATDVDSKEQLVLEKIGEAFLSIPSRLAASAGLDPIDSIISMRSSDARLHRNTYGIDGISRKVADVSEIPIAEPLHVKKQVLQTTFETVLTILRIDNVIQSRELSREEKFYVERQEKNSPEKRKKMYIEQGIW